MTVCKCGHPRASHDEDSLCLYGSCKCFRFTEVKLGSFVMVTEDDLKSIVSDGNASVAAELDICNQAVSEAIASSGNTRQATPPVRICSCKHQLQNHNDDGVCMISNCKCVEFEGIDDIMKPLKIKFPDHILKQVAVDLEDITKIRSVELGKRPKITPDLILDGAIGTLKSRGVEYDGQGYDGGERSMEKTLAIFKALTDIELSLIDGWRFIICLKLARSTTGAPKLDTYIDLAGYAALAGEAALAPKDTP